MRVFQPEKPYYVYLLPKINYKKRLKSVDLDIFYDSHQDNIMI